MTSVPNFWPSDSINGSMGGIYELCHWDGLRWYDLHNNFHKDWLRHTKVVRGDTNGHKNWRRGKLISTYITFQYQQSGLKQYNTFTHPEIDKAECRNNYNCLALIISISFRAEILIAIQLTASDNRHILTGIVHSIIVTLYELLHWSRSFGSLLLRLLVIRTKRYECGRGTMHLLLFKTSDRCPNLVTKLKAGLCKLSTYGHCILRQRTVIYVDYWVSA
jgi:hypothetical protein